MVQVVGNTTSGCYSYNLRQSLCMAYVPLELSGAGTVLEVELLSAKCAATVLKQPPFAIESARKAKA